LESVIYLLDTDILVYLIRGLKSARRPARQRAERLAKRCEQVWSQGDSVGLSAITVSEMEFGARKSANYEAEMAAYRKVEAPFAVYDYDGVLCPAHYGRIRYELEIKGVIIGAMDLLIAAQALALDATLVSNNVAHFSRVSGLKTANWLNE
jgi:tRNA(fMet)-specific endonuclease VapC